jgi:hypothetical protein
VTQKKAQGQLHKQEQLAVASSKATFNIKVAKHETTE